MNGCSPVTLRIVCLDPKTVLRTAWNVDRDPCGPRVLRHAPRGAGVFHSYEWPMTKMQEPEKVCARMPFQITRAYLKRTVRIFWKSTRGAIIPISEM